jgi:hypothetical protein
MSVVVLVGAVLAFGAFTPAEPQAGQDRLGGIDTVPPSSLLAGISTADLLAVALDGRQPGYRRARALRLLGSRPITNDDSIDATLEQLSSSSLAGSELAVQLVLARADRARQRSLVAAEAVGLQAIAAADAAVVAAGAVVLWQLGGDANRARLQHLAANHRDANVRGACRGRLAWWHQSGGWLSPGPGVLDQRHGGPSPAPRR